MLKAILDKFDLQLKIQVFLTGVLTSQFAIWFGWLAAWGYLPGLDVNVVSSTLAGVIASLIASVIAGAVSLYIGRDTAVINAVGQMGDEGRSNVAGVVMKEDHAANEISAQKVVGPSDVGTL